MGKKLFVVSDIHGHYTELKMALEEVGFDEKNEDHVFVSCGDMFDRGSENSIVYDFISTLKQKILIKGNHEDRLYEILEQGSLLNRDRENQTDITINQLLEADALDSDGCFDLLKYSDKILEIKAFIDSMLDYYEADKYVFTHGWLPVDFEDGMPYIKENWREVSSDEWFIAHELQWQQFYGAKATLDGKIIVCGHRPSSLGYWFDSTREYDCSEPFYGNGIIAIDAHTIRSGRVNVLVIEENQ